MACSECGEPCSVCINAAFGKRKAEFHVEGLRAVRELATRLGLTAVKTGTYDSEPLASFECVASSNKAGPAVIGDVSLRGQWFYLCLNEAGGFVRKASRDDIYGTRHTSPNHHIRHQDLESESFVDLIRSFRPKIKRRASARR